MVQLMNKYLFCFIILLFSTSNINAETRIEHKIAVLVNDEVITSYDIIQRLKLTAIIQGININAQNNQLLLNNVVDELIQERVKLEKINEYEIKADETEYQNFELNFYERKNISQNQMLLLLEKNNISYKDFENLLMNELLWSKLISGLFYRLTSVSDLEINELISKNPSITSTQAEALVIQRQLDLQSSKLLRDIMNEATIEYK